MSGNSASDELTEAIAKIIAERKPQNARQLISLVEEHLHLPEKEIFNAVMELQSQGKVNLDNQPLGTSPKMAEYLKTSQALWYWMTVSATTVAAALVLIVPEDLYPFSLLRIAFGLLFVLWLPGYAFTKALFPQKGSPETAAKNLETIERIALSIGISLALVPMIGLILYYTPLGINLTPIVLSLLAPTLLLATIEEIART